MEYKIEKISSKIHNITEEESNVIKRALPFYNNILDRYEKQLLSMKEENDKRKEQVKTLDEINPFDYNSSEEKNYMPNINEVMTFAYSAWAKTVADVQTPFGSNGQKKKGIVKHCFREVQKGKFINKKVRETMDNFATKMKMILDIRDEK